MATDENCEKDHKDHHIQQKDDSDSVENLLRGAKRSRSRRKDDRKKKKSKKSKKRDKKRRRERRGHRDDSDEDDSQSSIDNSSSSESSIDSYDYSKRDEFEDEKKLMKREKRRRDDREGEGDISDCNIREDNFRRSKKRSKEKHKRSKKDKKKKAKKRSSRVSSSSMSVFSDVDHRRERDDCAATTASAAPPGAHKLAQALTDLFSSHPSMSLLEEGGIPLLLLKLPSGTEYNFSQMPNRNLAQKMDAVFEAMGAHGVTHTGKDGAWRWGGGAMRGKSASGGGSTVRSDLTLLRLARALLDGVGMTVDAVEEFEAQELEEKQRRSKEMERSSTDVEKNGNIDQSLLQQKNGNALAARSKVNSAEDITRKKRVERMAFQLLDRFDPLHKKSVKKPTTEGEEPSSQSCLAVELEGICNMLVEGEIINLDGIPDAKLRAVLGQLFKLIGLELAEMEEEAEEDDNCDGGDGETSRDVDAQGRNGDQRNPKVETEGTSPEKAMGYALPVLDEQNNGAIENIHSRIAEVLRVCRFRSSDGMEGAPTAWAGSKSHSYGATGAEDEGSSSDGEDGPLPAESVTAVKRKQLTAATVRAMAERRTQILVGVKSGLDGHHIPEESGGREEWMMTPGEHDFMKGIASSTRSRTFKNERNRGKPIASSAGVAEEPVDPKVRAEVAAIQKVYEDSRGPRLLDAHRRQLVEKKASEKASGKGGKWEWNRDKNLEDGRRVDKNALHLVLGGAEKELKSKFQGGHGQE